MLIERERSQVLVVDVQEKLFPAMDAANTVVPRTRLLLQAAGHLDVPVLVSEQYPSGLGRTLADIAEAARGPTICEKTHFSAYRDTAIATALNAARGSGRSQIVVAGIETHVCVAQTALDLCAEGFEVFVAADAVASRRPEDRHYGLERMRQAGACVVTAEAAVFEWMQRAGTPEFRAIAPLLKPV